jgi:hypothetical protein
MSQQQRQKAPIKAFTESRDEGRGGYLNLPEGVKHFKLERIGNPAYKLDFIPYVVGKGNPAADEGMIYFERTFYVHRNLGPDGRDSAVCNLSTFRKRCKFCEHREQLHRNGMSYKDTADLKAKTRIIFRVIDRANADAGIQVWETGDYKSFGALLKGKITAVEDYADFYDLDNGYTLQLSVGEDSFDGRKYNAVTNIEMVKRKKPLDEGWLEDGPNLDDCIKPISDKDALRLLNPGEDESEEEDAPKPPKSAKAKPRPADDDEDDDPPAKPSKAKKPAAVEEDDEDDDDIPVKPTKGKTLPPSGDDDDDDEMPPPPRGRR